MSNKIHELYYGNTKNLLTRLNTWKTFGSNKVPLGSWIISHLPEIFKEDISMLDVGCGTGWLLKDILMRNPAIQFHAIDLSSVMVTETRKRFSNNFDNQIIQGDLLCLPYKKNSFDLITVIHVFHHIEDIKRALKELKRVIKPNGTIFITTSDYQINKGLNKIHYSNVKKLGFPSSTYDINNYTLFKPKIAKKYINGMFPSCKIYYYKNDAIFDQVLPCLTYYKSAMMFRNTDGYKDKNISKNKWEALISNVSKDIKGVIEVKGKFIQPSKVIGFKITAHG